jgi:hypothetical protein
VEILTVHEVLGKRLIALPEDCLPLAKEVMILPEKTADGPAWIIVPRDVEGRQWMDANLQAYLNAPERVARGKESRAPRHGPHLLEDV